MENFKTRKRDASDYHNDHPYMQALEKVLSNYAAPRGIILLKDEYEQFKIDLLNALFHPQPQSLGDHTPRLESPNKK
jgi:hypothetical protein